MLIWCLVRKILCSNEYGIFCWEILVHAAGCELATLMGRVPLGGRYRHHDSVMKVVDPANVALRSTHGRTYSVGCGPCVLYAAYGTSMDWVPEALGVRVSFTIEVRPKFAGSEEKKKGRVCFFFLTCK